MFRMNVVRMSVLQVAAALALSVAPLSGPDMAHASARHLPGAVSAPVDMVSLQESTQYLTDGVHSGLIAHDQTSLEQRMPLILIHGIGGNESKLFHWENFLAYAAQHPTFNQRYKIYLYHYDSRQSVPAISNDLRHTLRGFVGALGGRRIKIVAYSEGGLLTRNALQDTYLDAHTEEVLTIATPFHGSPLANPEWIARQVKSESPLNLARLARAVAYRITGRKYPTFREDFQWDNFDGALPRRELKTPHREALPDAYTLASKANFTTYGSYFGTAIDPEFLPQQLNLDKSLPQERLMPGNVFKKNFLFSVIRNNIGKLPLAYASLEEDAPKLDSPGPEAGSDAELSEVALDEQPILFAMQADARPLHPALAAGTLSVLSQSDDMPPEPADTNLDAGGRPVNQVSMMVYNDGISPISSTLWLGRFTPRFANIEQPVERLWETLKSLRGNRNTRLFAGLDHRNWMDGETRTGEARVLDLLNPDEGPKTVFEWIIYDLMS